MTTEQKEKVITNQKMEKSSFSFSNKVSRTQVGNKALNLSNDMPKGPSMNLTRDLNSSNQMHPKDKFVSTTGHFNVKQVHIQKVKS